MFIAKSIAERLLIPVIFFDYFDHPLTEEELRMYIPGPPLSKTFLLRQLAVHPLLDHRGQFVFLKGRSEIVAKRRMNEKFYLKLWQKIKRYNWIFQLVPFVKMAAVCNSVAMGAVSKESDIDLFIITKRNRLFLARTLLLALASILRLRRHSNNITGRFCFSFLISEEEMDLSKIMAGPDDIYLTYWMRSLKPILGEDVYLEFLRANRNWLKEYFSDFDCCAGFDCYVGRRNIFFNNKNRGFLAFMRGFIEWIFSGWLGNFLENILSSWQISRANEKHIQKDKVQCCKCQHSGVHISKTMLKFHELDIRHKLQSEWVKAFSRHLLSLSSK